MIRISGQAVKLWPFSCLERDVGHVAPAGVLSLPRGAIVGGACLRPAENEARLVVILYVARCVVSVRADTWLGAAAMPAVVAAVVVVPFVHVNHERAKRHTRRARLHSS